MWPGYLGVTSPWVGWGHPALNSLAGCGEQMSRHSSRTASIPESSPGESPGPLICPNTGSTTTFRRR